MKGAPTKRWCWVACIEEAKRKTEESWGVKSLQLVWQKVLRERSRSMREMLWMIMRAPNS